mmetsp:Transcript_39104/g.85751  ORF Transcript_39104/g.85751 Transcript_39104/m.85751 type:complete len:347 (-) Transcript_39104:102-1142(-)
MDADGTLNERELKWLHRRAVGGYGIVNSCCVHVQANGKGWEGEWGLFDEKHVDGYRTVAKAVHEEGGLFIVQIFHAGMRSDDKLIDGPARSCVDTVYKHRAGEREVKGLTEPEIEALIDDFVTAAKRAEEAGCDGVEIHGAHGYILTQFLCPELNTRTDKWGGSDSLENRARITREVTRRIRQATSPDFIVGIRLSPEPGYESAGWMMDPDENIQLAKWLAEDRVDFVSVSLFGHSPSHVTPKHKERGETRPLAQVFRDELPDDVVVMCCGGVASGKDVQTLLDMGIDVAVTGKTAISTPDFPMKVQETKDYEVAVQPPYSLDHLASVDVSPPFVDFLRSIRMVAE